MGRDRRPSAGAGDLLDQGRVDRLREAMLDWFAEHGRRGLPWRADRDPYRVLVSEIMLVQTTVAAAGPFFERFLGRFPTVEALAEADEAAVLKAWEGLGYYRRARQLHAAARAIVAEHGGRVPEGHDALLRLPGVGRYIAGAVRSIAFDRPAPILEANSLRVFARWVALRDDVRTPAAQSRIWEIAERLVPPCMAGQFNQAIMDLGAMICTVASPRCLACPVRDECAARRANLQDAIPLRVPRAKPLAVEELCALARRDDGRFLVVRRAGGGLWDGFYEFPTLHLSGADPAARGLGDGLDLSDRFRALTGVALRLGPEVHSFRFGVTKHRVALTARLAAPSDGTPRPGPGLSAVRWLTLDELASHSRTVATRRLSDWLAEHPVAFDER